MALGKESLLLPDVLRVLCGRSRNGELKSLWEMLTGHHTSPGGSTQDGTITLVLGGSYAGEAGQPATFVFGAGGCRLDSCPWGNRGWGISSNVARRWHWRSTGRGGRRHLHMPEGKIRGQAGTPPVTPLHKEQPPTQPWFTLQKPPRSF